jgi:hypothetical protein
MSVKPERKLWHELKNLHLKYRGLGLKIAGSFGTPDLLGYNHRGTFLLWN